MLRLIRKCGLEPQDENGVDNAIGAAVLARYVSRDHLFTCEHEGPWEIDDLLKTFGIREFSR